VLHAFLTCRYDAIDRFAQGLSALMLILRGRPTIRYQKGSPLSHALAQSLHTLVYKQVVLSHALAQSLHTLVYKQVVLSHALAQSLHTLVYKQVVQYVQCFLSQSLCSYKSSHFKYTTAQSSEVCLAKGL